MRRQKINVPIIGAQIWADPEIVNGMGAAGDDSVFAAPFYYNLNDRTRSFTKKFVAAPRNKALKSIGHIMWMPRPMTLSMSLRKAMEVAKVTGDADKIKAERTAIRDVLGTITYDWFRAKFV